MQAGVAQNYVCCGAWWLELGLDGDTRENELFFRFA